jgi:hypothetical protein
MRHVALAAALIAVCVVSNRSFAQPLTTSFTYQGEINDTGTTPTGNYDFRFRLYDSAAGLTQVGPTLCVDNVALTNGRFVVSLDFGAQYAGQQRFLEIDARKDTGLNCSSSVGFATLSPRQPLTATPNAAFALTAATATNATTLNGQPATFYQNAANLTAGTLPNNRTTGTVANSPNALVLRDASGNFTANTITATLQGNAATATNASNATNANFATTAGNAQSLNGQLASFYTDATNLSAGTLSDLRLSSNIPRLNAANTFSGNNSVLGNLSVGTVAAPTFLSVSGDQIRFSQSNGVVSLGTAIDSNIGYLQTHSAHPLGFATNNNVAQAILLVNGNFGIGTTAPSARLHLSGGGMKIDGTQSIEFGAGIAGKETSAGRMGYGTFVADALNIVGAGNTVATRKLHVFAEGGSFFTGRVSATTVEIRGGADITEGFDSTTQNIEPGTLMVIDPEHPGQLMPSTSAYDRKVAGIVSGAGGVNSGLHMGQDSVLNGKHPIAMTGRVYVKCSAANGPIIPGDRLTTSLVPGHAMKATDPQQWDGAVIGKAMSSLDQGEGLVLVLVNLQ